MIRVIVEGPQGSGKTRLAGLIAIVCSQHGLSTVSRDEGQHEEFDDMGFDVVLIEKQTDV